MTRSSKKDEEASEITRGTTNVFADLGLADAQDRQTKTRLAMEINEILKSRKLKQSESAALLGVPQPKVSALVNFRLDGFSIERLMVFLTRLNRDVEIVIRPSRDERGGQVSVHAMR
jgi:predicted XRE-type DNA-binding protein